MQGAAYLFVLAVLVAGASTGPTGTRARNQCVSYCKDANKFKYDPGQVYVYDYTADTVTTLRGATTDESRLHVTARAEVEAISPCEFVLTLKDVTLQDSNPNDARYKTTVDGNTEFSYALQRYPLRFAYQDGSVEQLCPSPEEPTWVLNIKRGVLSAFQNSMKDLDNPQIVRETDVSGNCEAEYSISHTGYSSITVRKTKDLLACTDRHTHFNALQSTPYFSESKVQSLPVVRANHECEQTIRNNRMEKSVCTEMHVFRPFSSDTSGAVTTVTQSLTYNSEYKSRLTGTDYTPTRASLLYEHGDPGTTTANRERMVQRTLQELEDLSREDVRPQVPHVFARLVYSLRPLSYQQLTKLFYDVQNKQTRKFLIDAMPLVGTSAGMSMMRDLIQKGEILDIEADIWLASLAFQKHPTLAMMDAVLPLLDGTPRQKALLGVSAMVNSYCKHHADCETKPQIQEIIRKFENLLGSGCRSRDSADEKLIILALKAIGNAGRTVASREVLRRCYQEMNSMDIRLAAVDAFRRIPCEDRSHLMDTFTDVNQDAELRIAAYLAVMKCPNSQVIQKVKDALYSESVNQVASFVWTHLTNLQESASRSKQEVKDLLANDFLRNKFNTDARKFSRNYEGSLYWKEINTGATAESNIIFSPKSYLPRSAMLNLTLDLFGESINLFEVGGRIEGFEHLVESFFGPNGYFPEETVSNILRSFRKKRDISQNAINEIHEVFNAEEEFADEPTGSMYLRMFGNEFHYAHFRGLQDIINMKNSINPLDMLLKLMHQQDIDYTKSFMFLDASYIIPTIAGLPLNLTVNGTATLGLKLSGKLDVQDIQNIDIHGHVKPSAAVEISGIMAVDAFVAKTGLKMVTTMHTSTFLDGKVEVKNGDVVSVNVNMPKDKMEILDVSVQHFLLHREQEFEQEGITVDRSELKACTPNKMATILGVELCGELQYANASRQPDAPYFPLSGPASVKLYIQKTDTFNGYEFKYRWQKKQISQQFIHKATVSLDTPGSRINRHTAVHFTLDEPAKAVKLSLNTPIKSIDIGGNYDYSPAMKTANLAFTMDERELFSLESSLRTTVSGRNTRYDPILIIRRRNSELMNMKSTININEGVKYSVDVNIQNLFQKPVRITADLNRQSTDQFEFSGSMKSYFLDGSIDSSMRIKEAFVRSKAKIEYSFYESTHNTLAFTSKLQKSEKGALSKYSTYMIVQSSQFPIYNTELSWDVQLSPGYLENNGRFIFGKTHWDISQLYSNQGIMGQKDMTFKLQLACPKLDIDYLFSMNHQTTATSLMNRITAHLVKKKDLISQVSYSLAEQPLKYSANVEVSYPGREIKLSTEVAENKPNEYDGHFSFQWQKGNEVKVVGTYKNLSSNVKLEHIFDMKARIPGLRNLNMNAMLLASAEQSRVSSEVEYGSNKYSGFLDYTRADENRLDGRLIMNNVKYTGMAKFRNDDTEKSLFVDLKWSRHIEMNAVLKPFQQAVNFDLFWDKDVDESQHITFSGRMKTDNIHGVLKYPGRVVEANVIIGNDVRVEVEWAPNKKVTAIIDVTNRANEKTAALKISTPFPGFEYIDTNGHYRIEGDAFDTQVSVTWKKEQMTLKVNGLTSQLKGNVHFTSTFEGFEDMSLSVSHLSSVNQLQFSINGAINRKEISLKANWENTNGWSSRNIIGSVTFTSPFKNLESLTAKMNLEKSSDNGRTHGEIEWAPNKKIEADISVKRTSSEVTSELIFKTPFTGYETATASGHYKYDGTTFNLISDAALGSKKIMFEVSGSHTTSWNNVATTEGKLRFTSPFTNDIIFNLVHTTGDKFSTLIKFQWSPQKVYNFQADGSFQSWSNYRINMAVVFPGHQITSQMNTMLTEKDMNIIADCSWNQDQFSFKLIASNEVDRNTKQVKINGAIITPFRLLDDIKLVTEHTTYDGSTTSRLQLSKNVQAIIISNNFKLTDTLNWENKLEVTTPFSFLHTATITNIQSFTNGKYQHDFEANYDGKKVSSSMLFTKNRNNVGAQCMISSPWKNIKIDFVNSNDGTSFSPRLSIEYGPGKIIKLAGKVMAQPMQSSLSFDLNIPDLEPVELQGQYDLSNAQASGSIRMKWQRNQEVQLSMDGQNTGLMTGTYIVSLKTPFTGYEKSSVEASFNIINPEKIAKISVNYAGKKIEVRGTAKFMNQKYEGNVQIYTPFQNFEHMTISTELDMGKPTKTATLSLQKNSAEIKMAGSLMLDTDSEFSLTFNSPIKSFESLAIYTRYSRSSSPRKFQVIFEHNHQRSSLVITGSYHRLYSSGSITLSLPVLGYEVLSASGEYDMYSNKKVTILKLQKNDKVAEITAEGFGNNMEGNFELNLISSFIVTGKAQLQLSYDFVKPMKTATIKMNINEQRGEAYFYCNGHVKKHKSGIQVKTPFEGYKNTDLAIEYDFLQTEQTASIAYKQDEYEYKIEGEIKIRDALKAKGSFEIRGKTPTNTMNTVKAEFKYDFKKADKVIELKMNTNSGKLSFTASGNFEGIVGKASAELTGTFCNHMNTRLEMEYNLQRKTVRFSIERNEKKHIFTGEMQTEDQTIFVKITTPFTGYKVLSLSCNYDITSSRKQGKLVLKKDDDNIIVSLNAVITRTNIQGQITVNTPFSGYETMDMLLKVDNRREDKSAILSFSKDNTKTEFRAAGSFTGTSGKTELSLTSPIKGWESIALQSSFDITSQYIGTFSFERNGNKKTFSGEANLSDDAARFKMTTPIPGYESVSGEGSISGNVASVSLNKNKDEVKLIVKGTLGEDTGNGQFILKTPFKNFESISISGSYDMKNEYSGSFTFEKNGIQNTFTGEAKISDGSAAVKVTTPFRNYENFSGTGSVRGRTGQIQVNTPFEGYESVRGEGTLSSESASIRLSKNNDEVKLDMQGAFTNLKGSGHITLSTPFKDFRSIAIEGTYDISSKYTGSFTFVQNGVKHTFSGEAALSEDTARFKVNTPFDGYDSFSGESYYRQGTGRLQINTPINGYETVSGESSLQSDATSFRLRKNNEEIKLAMTGTFNSKDGKGSITINTPYSGFESIGISGSYDINYAYTGTVTFEKNQQKTTFSGEVSLTGNTVNFHVKTPYQGFESISGEGSFQDQSARFRIQTPFPGYQSIAGEGSLTRDSAYLRLNWNNKEIKLTASGSSNSNKGNGHITVQTTFSVLESLSLSGSYDISSAYSGSLTLEVNGKKKTLSGEVLLNGNSAKVKVNTPFEGYGSFSGDGTLSRDSARLNLQTPFQGYESISSEGHISEESVTLRLKKNAAKIDLSVTGSFSEKKGKGEIKIAIPVKNWESIALYVNYDFTSEYRGTFTFEKNNEKHTLSGKAAITEDSVRFNMETPIQGYDSFSGEGRMSSESTNVRFQTPFHGYEDVAISSSYNNDNNQKKASLSFEQNGVKKDFGMSLTFDASSVDLKLNTPFPGYKRLEMTVTYILKGENKNVGLILTRNNDRYQFDISGSFRYEGQYAKMEIQVTTPFPAYKKMNINGNYNIIGDEKSISLFGTMNEHTLSFMGKLDIRRKQMTMTLTTPFRGYERMRFTANINTHSTQKTASISLQRNDERTDMSGALRLDDNSASLSINTPFSGYETFSASGKYETGSVHAEITTPFRGYEHMAISLEFINRRSSKNGKAVLTMNNYKYEISLSSRLETLNSDATLTIRTSIPSYENMVLSGRYDLRSERKSAALKYERNGRAEISTSGIFTYQGMQANMNFEIITTFPGYEHMIAAASYNIPDSFRSIEASLQVGNYQVKMSGRCQDMTGHLTIMQTVISQGKNIEIRWQFENSVGSKKADIAASLDDKRIHLITNLKIHGIEEVQGMFFLLSPFTKEHKIEFQWNAHSNKFNGKVTYNEENLSLDTNMKYNKNFGNIDIKFTSPFRDFEDLALQSKYSLHNKNIGFTLQWKPNSKIDFDAQLKTDNMKAEGKVTFTAPFIHPIIFKTEYDFTTPQKTFSALFKYNTQAVQLTGNLQHDGLAKAEGRITFTSPFRGFSTIILSGSFNTIDHHGATLTIEKENKKIDLTARLSVTKNNIDTHITFTSPFSGLEKLNLHANYERTSTAITATTGLQWSYKEIHIKFTWEKGSMKLAFNSPFETLNNLGFDCTYNLENDEKSGKCTFDWGQSKVVISGNFLYTESDSHLRVYFSSPFRGAENIILNANYKPGPEHNTILKLQWGDRTTELTGKFNFKLEKSHAEITFASPLSGAESLMFKLEYDLTNPSLSVSSTIQWGSKKINFAATESNNQQGVKSNVKLTTPFEGFESMSLNTDINVSENNMAGTITAESGTKKVELTCNGRYQIGEGNGQLTLSTPFSVIRNVKVDVSFNNRKADISLEYGRREKIEIKAIYEMQAPIYSINATLSTPFRMAEKMVINTYLNTDHLYGMASFEWDQNKQIEIVTELRGAEIMLYLDSPYTPARNMRFTGSYVNHPAQYGLSTVTEWNTQRLSLRGKMMNDASNYGVSANAEWEDQKANIEATIQKSGMRYVKSILKIKTPFKVFDNLDFDFTFNMDDQNTNARMRLKTPFKALPTLTAAMDFKIDNMNAIEGSLTATVLDKTMAINAKVSNERQNDIRGQLTIDIPFTELKQVFLMGTMRKTSWKNVEVDLSLTTPTSSNKVNGHYTLEDNKLDVSMNINTPLMEKNVKFGYFYNAADYTGMEGNAYFNNDKLSGSYRLQRSNFKAEVNIHAPSFRLVDIRAHADASFQTSRTEITLMFTKEDIKGKVSAGHECTDTKISGHAEIDTDLIDTKKALTFNLFMPSYYEKNVKFEASLISKTTHLLTSNIKWGNRIVVSGKINSQVIGDMEVSLNVASTQGTFSMLTPNGNHQASYVLNYRDGYQATITLNSPLLPSNRLIISGVFKNVYNVIQASLTAETTASTHSLSGIFNNYENSLSTSLKLQTPFYNINTMSLQGKVSNTEKNYEAFITLDAFDHHSISAIFNKLPIEGEIVVQSPFLPFNTLSISGSINTADYNDKQAEISFAAGSKRFKLAGKLHKDSETVKGIVTINTPFSELSMVKVNANYRLANVISAEMNIQTSNQAFPKAGFSAKYSNSGNVIDASLSLETPCEYYKKIGFLINIPLRGSKLQPYFTLTTPYTVYTLRGDFNMYPGKVDLKAFAGWEGKKMDTNIKFSWDNGIEAHIEVNTPFWGYEHYEWDLKGDAILRNWARGEASVYVEWNKKKIEFSSRLITEPRTYISIIELNTPFQDYERYAVTLRFQGTERKTVHAQIEYPGQSIGIEFDYYFNSLLDFTSKATINTPFVGYESFSLALINRLKEYSYAGSIEGKWAPYALVVNVDGTVKDNTAKGGIEAMLNDYVFTAKLEGSVSENKGEVIFDMDTPFQSVRNINSFIRGEKRGQDYDTGIGASCNGKKIFNLSVTLRGDVTTVEIHNPSYPVSVSYSIENNSGVKKLKGEVCWDLNNKHESSLGGEIHIKDTSYGRDLTIKTIAPNRVLSLTVNHEKTSDKLDHSVSFSWDTDKTLGYKILLEDASGLTETKYNAILHLKFPVRSFQIESHHTASSSAQISSIELKWDAARDPNKMMSIQMETRDLSSWGRTAHDSKLILHHSALQQDITLYGQFATAKSNEILFTKTELIYSPIQNHKLSMILSVTDESSGSNTLYKTIFTLQHPACNIDVHLTSTLTNTPEETSGNVHVSYTDNHNKKHFLEIGSKVQYTQQQIMMEMKSTDHSFDLMASLKDRGEDHIAFLETKLNNQKQLTAEGKISFTRPSAELDIDLGRNHRANVFAGMRSKREVSMKAYHKSYGQEVLDGIITMKLNSSHLLSIHSYWRPTAMSDLKNAIVEYYDDFYYSVLGLRNVISDFITVETSQKTHILLPTAQDTLYKLSNYMSHEISTIRNDFQDVITTIRTMYWNNEFYMRTIYDFIADTFGTLNSYMSHVFDGITYGIKAVGKVVSMTVQTVSSVINYVAAYISELTQEVIHYAREKFTEIIDILSGYINSLIEVFKYYTEDMVKYYETAKHFMLKYYGRIEIEVMEMLDELEAQIRPVFEKYLHMYSMYYNKVVAVFNEYKAGLDGLKKTVLGYFKKMRDSFLGLELVEDAIALYNDYATWLEEFHAQDYIDSFKSWSDSSLNNVIEKYRKLTRHYRSYTDAIYEAARGHYQKMKRLPPIAYLSDVMNRIYQKTAWMWRYFEFEDVIRNGLHNILSKLDNYVTGLYSKIEQAGSMDVKQIVVYEPEKGHFEYTQYLPVSWESFEEMPKFDELPIFHLAEDPMLNNIDINTYYYEFLDAIHNYTPDYNIRSWIPPFGTHAMLAGKQHYMTFDQRFFEFAGECSYLLASDFIDSNFSVVVNYAGRDGEVTKKSLTVVSDKKMIDIGTNYKVTVDGRKVELPQEFENTELTREGSKVIVHNKHGITVECNLFRDVCTVEMSGWYYGKTGGLFGTYDNEPNNDFMTPDRQIKNEVDSFAYSWKVGSSRCKIKNYAVEATNTNDWACHELYESQESPFRPCFKHVNPAPFKKMCVNDLMVLENSPLKEIGICSSGAAYVTECKFAGIDIWQPSVCVRCEMEDGTVMRAGELKTYKDNQAPSSSDVVFIVDQQPCLKDYHLEDITDRIEGALQEQSIVNNRYAVVGYGGKGVYEKPRIHTTNNNIWVNKRNIQATFEGLKLEGEGGDVHTALAYAANLPMRPGVSKTMILVSCGECNDASSYADALTMLIEHDITLHILSPSEIRLRSKRPEYDSKILGYDSEAAYTFKDVGVLSGDMDLRRQLRIPKDFCTPLAMETNGTVFNLNKMNPSKRISAKKSIDVFSRRLALTSKPSDCQRCECFADRDGKGNVQCQRCVSPSIDEFLKTWKRISYNEDDYMDIDFQPTKKAAAKKSRKSRGRKMKRD